MMTTLNDFVVGFEAHLKTLKQTGQLKQVLAADGLLPAVAAFLNAVGMHRDLSHTWFSVGEALLGRRSASEDEVKQAARLGFVLCNRLAAYAGAVKVKQKDYTLANGVASAYWAKQYILKDGSPLRVFMEEVAAAKLGLQAEMPADYLPSGVTADGSSIFLSGKVGPVGPVLVKGVNSVQKQAYTLKPVMLTASDVLEALLAAPSVVQKGALVNVQTVARMQQMRGKVAKGSTLTQVEDLPVTELKTLAAGLAFLKEHGKAYVTYRIDDRGRQYPVATFSHYSKPVLLLLLGMKDLANETLEKAGLSKAKAVEAVKAMTAGDVAKAKFFYVTETGVTKTGKTVYASSFNVPTLAAALVLASE
jgi:hypothetical protein